MKRNAPDIPEYDLDANELIYRDAAGKEVRRKKFGEIEMEPASGARRSIHWGCENHPQEETDSSLLLPSFKAYAHSPDILIDPRPRFLGGLRFGGTEYFLLTPRGSTCETVGWKTFS